MSGELHLDLCQQSTSHLKEVISSIKENLRILEVFLNSGLGEEEHKRQTTLSSTEANTEPYFEKESQRNKSSSQMIMKAHLSCCCMCPSRQSRSSGWVVYCPEGRISSSPTLNQKKLFPSSHQRPVSMPRLNRTASLRRDNALERSQKGGNGPSQSFLL